MYFSAGRGVEIEAREANVEEGGDGWSPNAAG